MKKYIGLIVILFLLMTGVANARSFSSGRSFSHSYSSSRSFSSSKSYSRPSSFRMTSPSGRVTKTFSTIRYTKPQAIRYGNRSYSVAPTVVNYYHITPYYSYGGSNLWFWMYLMSENNQSSAPSPVGGANWNQEQSQQTQTSWWSSDTIFSGIFVLLIVGCGIWLIATH